MKQVQQAWRSEPAASWRFWYILLQIIVFLPAKLVFRLTIEKDPRIRQLRKTGPLIVIAPHQSFIDPVFVAYGTGIGVPLRFVATDLLLRNKLGRWFVRHTGCIPITQFSSDTGAIRSLLQALRKGQNIAIFPEGERSLDGIHYLPRNALLRIFKRAETTIVGVEIFGAYLTWPRWSTKSFGRGKVQVKSKVLVEASEVKNMSDDELAQRLEPLFSQDDYSWQQERIASGKRPYSYAQRQRACGITTLLHSCLHCQKLQVMRADANQLICSNCQQVYVLQKSGLIGQENELLLPTHWHNRQQQMTREHYPVGLRIPCRGYSYHPTRNSETEVDQSTSGLLNLSPSGELYFITEDEKSPLRLTLESSSLVYRLGNNAYIQFSSKETKERYRFVFEQDSSITLFIDYLQMLKEKLCKNAVK